jgi:hypothetical protein
MVPVISWPQQHNVAARMNANAFTRKTLRICLLKGLTDGNTGKDSGCLDISFMND